MEFLHIAIKLVIGFFVLFLLIKVLGKKIVDQVTPFTFIAAVVLSELLGNAVYNKETPVIYFLFAALLWGLLFISVEYFGQKSLFFRRVFEGQPSMLIHNGKINFDQLKKNRMNLNQLQSLLRQSEVFSIREVAYAFLESNGSISIIKTSRYQKTTQEDFNMPEKPVYIPFTLIRDGDILQENLQEIGKDEHWLRSMVQAKGVSDPRNVFLAEWLEGDGLLVVPCQSKQNPAPKSI